MPSKPVSIDEYLATLPDDRRTAIEAVRQVILDNLDEDYEEGVQYGMIGYYVPHRVFPDGYHCDPKQPLPFASLASQKNHMAFYFMALYGDAEQEAWLQAAWKKTGKKLDMGKACIRFKKLEDLPLEVIGEAVRRIPAKAYIARYEKARPAPKGKAKAASSTKKPAAPAKKPATKKKPAEKRA